MESDGEATVEIGIISGYLQRDVSFQLTFSSGSALGNVTQCPNFFPQPFLIDHCIANRIQIILNAEFYAFVDN